mgnify:FL=1
MKFGKLRTLRGQIEVNAGGAAKRQLITADGLVNYGLKITKFTLWTEQALSNATLFTGVLSLDVMPASTNMNAGDNRQIGWTFGSTVSGGSYIVPREILDPDHIVNRDLFLNLINSTNGIYNYLIECQVVELTDDEAIITIIKETSQS